MSVSLIDGWDRASLAQHGMWITERMGAGGRVYAMPLAVRFDGPLDVDAMLAACAAVVGRHPVLAATLAEQDGHVRLVPGEAPPPIRFEDVSGPSAGAFGDVSVPSGGTFEDVSTPSGATSGEVSALSGGACGPSGGIEAEISRPFDLVTGPLARFTLFRLAPARHVLQLVAHHAVFDGMSKDIVLRDLAAAYGGSALPPLPISYGEAARAEQDRVAAGLEGAAEFWRPRWHDDQDLLLPGAARPSLRAAPGEIVDLALGGEAAGVAERLGLTRFEVVLAALHTLLHGYGNDRVAVAVDLSTRTEETRDHVGLFVNELPVVSTPRGTFAEFARSIREELRAVYRYREVPLARALGGISPRTALTPVSVSYRRRSGADPVFPGLDASVDWTAFNGAVRNTLHLQVVESPDGLAARLQFNPAVLSRAACESVAGNLRTLLLGVAARPDAPITELSSPGREAVPTRDAAPAGAPGTAPASAAIASGTASAAIASGAVAASAPDAPAAAGAAAGAVADPALLGEVEAIWCEVLGVDEIRPDDDLFDLGGHSLSITQIIARVRDRMDVELSFEVFIDTPTVAGVAEEIARSR
ncbi:Condensation domain-containing protein [Streptosporangium canum]|uniref:Condensation domain-containing protein n=1 Tax=Streptosporangium canum TaxID=324952 RepID=A0A1I3ZM04_9ACTN|nr:condensation domain-containing protein [Streptosporangium canum]SFK45082.1 Condensation domain-containing protein [Streptosporangium canum]